MKKSLRIRMYNVGFGDCFLITLPDKKTILVDAGFHSQGRGAFRADELVDQLISDLKEISGAPRIDVVIATHRHADHIYAFNSDKWEDVDVGEVWMPWLEDRKNPEARKLWKKQQAFAYNLALTRQSLSPATPAHADLTFVLWNAGISPETLGLAADGGGWSNLNALDCLHGGFRSRDLTRPRFLPVKEAPETFETAALPGVRVHVLGPPRDAELIEELDPEADGETYRALALRGMQLAGKSISAPFGQAWQLGDSEPGEGLSPEEIKRLESLGMDADFALAAKRLDSMINSTSLVLILEIGKAVLLLPGDAEWGTWKRILSNDDARALLRDATFFKVGHHGSHNATSKTLVEDVLPKRIPAMISTQEGDGNYRNNIPLNDLLTALHEHQIQYARSDATEELPQGFEAGPEQKWIDLSLPC